REAAHRHPHGEARGAEREGDGGGDGLIRVRHQNLDPPRPEDLDAAHGPGADDVKTDDLINALSRGVEPAERPRWRMKLAITLIAGLVVAALLVAIGLGVRPDIGTARMPIMMKALFAALAAAIILPIAVQLMKPG